MKKYSRPWCFLPFYFILRQFNEQKEFCEPLKCHQQTWQKKLLPQCYRQWLYIAPLCITLRIKMWVVAYFNPKWNTFQKLFNSFSPLSYVTFLCRAYNSFKKVEKPPSKVAQKTSNPLFFSLLPWLPKRPKQKNSCSKMWPIDKLYIELGFLP